MTREEALQHVEKYGRYVEGIYCGYYAVMFEGNTILRSEPIELVEEILKRSREYKGTGND